MLVRLLGQVSAEVDGEPVRLGPQLRTLLAVLALHAGEPVPPPRLVEALWGGRASPQAVDTLRSHVSHLRRVLEPGRPSGTPPEVLVGGREGYALCVLPGEIDAVEFERLAERGRRALEDGDPLTASECLGTALAMWRGPALDGVADRGSVTDEAARLEGLRRAAIRTRFDADIAIGRHAEILVELEGVLAGEPDDERVRRLLAVALYRSGHHRRAAQVCADGLVLAHRYGLETSGLERLQEEILARSPALEPVRPAERPFELPPDVAEFTGRGRELGLLHERFARSHEAAVITAIDGPPGVGKTALAIHLAHALAPRFTDGVLYVNLRGAEPQSLAPLVVLGSFLRALGVPDQRYTADLETATRRYRSALAGRRVLVVLDNAAGTNQVAPLLPTGPGSAGLITSRRPLTDLEGAVPLSLDVLPDEDGRALLARFIGDERLVAEGEEAESIIRQSGALPLALRIVGARLRTRPAWSLSDMARQLADERNRLNELTVGEMGVRSSFHLSYTALAPGDRRTMRLLGILDCPEPGLDAVAELTGRPVEETRAALDRLADAQLLAAPAPGRYRFHDLMRLFARQQAETEETEAARTEALTRVLGWYAARAEEAGRLIIGRPGHGTLFDDRLSAMTWLETERPNLVAAVQQAAQRTDGLAEVTGTLEAGLYTFFLLRRYWSDWEAVCDAALSTARHRGDLASVAAVLNRLGGIHIEQRRYEQAIACFTESRALAEGIGDRLREGIVLNNLGFLHYDRGNHEEAAGLLERGLGVLPKLGGLEEGNALDTLGNVYRAQGRHHDAITCLERSLDIARRIDAPDEEATVLISIGRLHLEQAHLGDAAARLDEALRLSREIGYHFGEGQALHRLGEAAYANGDRHKARAHWREALAIFTGLGAPTAEGVRALLADSR